ncbi:MAG TPA: type 1 glutamine amidotransferase domain-containing protein [Leptospiraceae bacterium]|nr:type 1 glutamine amidotransferase domain-containing protein [Leptospiraceae bacterium]HMX31709.1 type 1 glutamine amidotransferase domain-containing protein [Leptospiraceae bacterium]HMY31995.1 type 1 glutamine amidotransferase domain-containing protein [Leptospiraceae bacterium]HMZ65792.1 type 1 glutamine amidotransferase domain-containing protein [Leptospiraceae bacterium]HNA09874.1 type 1 glutamine amidotransferase domain-containing protein [Leptospiraceae bacterium]
MILMPIPNHDFDPTETAIPWKILTSKGYQIEFATPDGKLGEADPIMLTGKGLGVWKKILMAREDAIAAYSEMKASKSFQNPKTYNSIRVSDYEGILLPGGHAKRMKDYLESSILQKFVGEFFLTGKPIGAICHGVVLAARSKNPETGKSILFLKKTTALLNSQEMTAYNLTRIWMGNYYLTYPEITVQNEIKSVLSHPSQFIEGPSPIFRDSEKNLDRGFSLRDGNYLSARWPGDAYNFSGAFINMLIEKD